MRDQLRYRLVDEPQPNWLTRFALPPILVFLIATFFQPWGFLLIATNAVALNGPKRNREIGYALAPIAIYYGAIMLLDTAVKADALAVYQARYLFVAAIGAGLVLAAFAYVSQMQTHALRRYLAERG